MRTPPVPSEVRGKNGSLLKAVRWMLVSVNVLLVAAAIYVSVVVSKRQEALGDYQQYSVAFVAAQGVSEYLRFQQRLSAFALSGTAEAADEAVLRYDILMSRLAMFGNGDFSVFLQGSPQRAEVMQKIRDVIVGVEPLMADLHAGANVREILRLTRGIETDFIGLSSDANSYGASYVAREQAYLFKLHWTFSVLALALAFSGFSLIAFNRWQNKQLSVARQSLADTNESLVKAGAELSARNVLFEAALDNMSHGLCMFGSDQRLIVSNKRMEAIFGLSEPLAAGTTLAELTDALVRSGACDAAEAHDLRRKQEALNCEGRANTIIHGLTDGRTVMVSHEPMEGGGWTATYEDITERYEAQARVAHLAKHDGLTDLPNRTLLRERLVETFHRDSVAGLGTVVMCLDLDNFKGINDTYGHPFGDSLLQEVAARLRRACRETDTVARLGGDEFVIVYGGVRNPSDLEDVAKRLIQSLAEPYAISGRQVVSGASVGIAVGRKRECGVDELMTRADLALYEAKSAGRGAYAFHTPEMSVQVERRSRIENDLLAASFDDQFQLAFQPIVNAASGKVESMEALLRWKQLRQDPVPPQEVISIAEDTGIIVDLGAWVLRTACRHAASLEGVRVAVNLSPIQFRRGGIVETVSQALAETGLPPSRLEVEITETLLLNDNCKVVSDLSALKELGVGISLDDFGTGYSSLSYLRKFPVDKIKIDRAFVNGINESEESKAIVKTIVDMADALGMTTVAEGVETSEQLEALREAGCTQVQGYFYSRPLLSAEAADYVRKGRESKAVPTVNVDQQPKARQANPRSVSRKA